MKNPLKKRPAETITLATGIAAVVGILVVFFPNLKDLEEELVVGALGFIAALPYIVSTLVDKFRGK